MNRRDRGGVFVTTLIMLVALTIIVSGVARFTRTEFRAQINRIGQIKAQRNAEAAIARALAEFSVQTTQANPGVTAITDPWAVLGNNASERFLVDDGSFRIQIVDASGYVNINSADQNQLERMPFSQEQIDSLLDWREAGRDPRPEGGKDEYYNALPVPYNAKLGPFDSVDELLLVRGFSASALYRTQDEVVSTATQVQGPDAIQPVLIDLLTAESTSRNISPSGQTKLNINTVNQQQMVQRGLSLQLAQAIIQRRNTQGTFTEIGAVLGVPGMNPNAARTVLDNFATTAAGQSTGLINLNTAPEAVLNTVPNLTPEISAAIVAQQQTGFTSVADLLNISGFSMQLLQSTARYFSVQSSSFIVRAVGYAGSSIAVLEAVVAVDQTGARVLKITSRNSSMPFQNWAWQSETSSEVDLVVTR